MNYKKEEIINLPDAKGEVKVAISPFTFYVFQNGVKLKKKGGRKPTYMIETTSGETEPMVVRNGKGMVRTAHYRDQQIPLEEKLTPMEQLIGIASMLVVFIAGCVLFGFITGVIGGALLGGLVAGGIVISFGFIRQEKSTMLQILVSVGISAVCYILYFVIGLVITMVIHGGARTFYY